MDFEQLEQFRMAAKLNHIGRAAEALNISQPALSQTIKRIEKRYRVSLFDRVGRTVRLNSNGQLLLGFVERALAVLQDADKAMDELSAPSQKSIALGYFGGGNAKAVTYLTSQFQGYGVPVDFGVHRGTSGQLFTLLKETTLDFCFTPQASPDEDIVSTALWHEHLFLHVSAKHRLANNAIVDLMEIADDPMLALKKGSDLRATTDALCEAAGFSPHIVFEGQNNVTLRGLVATDVGVALAPEMGGEDRDVVALFVRTPVCVRPIYFSWVRHRYQSKVAGDFRDFVLSCRTKLQVLGLEPIP
jgi:DNA-binding transcriptional LysR family regulator